MQIIKFGEKLTCPIIVCLGYFGCMHKGHVKLLETAKKTAAEFHAKVALFTFSNNHLKLLGKDSSVLYTYRERLEIYNSLSVDYLIVADFNNDFRSMMGEEFLRIFKDYDLKGVVCGYDHRCGSNKLDCNGIENELRGVCSVEIVDEITVDNVKISTTLVKKLITNRQILKANSLLSEPYFIIGNVVHGRGVGKTLGFPTANLQIDAEKLLSQGVYGGYTYVDGIKYKCIVNIGRTPTFGIDRFNVEAHLIEFSGDLYGRELKVSITSYLRDIEKFSSVNDLANQLKADTEKVLND